MFRTLATALALTLGLACAVQAGPPKMPDEDLQLMSGYTLSVDRLNKYADVLRRLNEACQKDPALRKRLDNEPSHEGETLAQTIKRVEADSTFQRYFKPAGLGARDAVLMPVVLIGAGAVVELNANPNRLEGLTQQQIDFYREHRDQIKKVRLEQNCGGIESSEGEESPGDEE